MTPIQIIQAVITLTPEALQEFEQLWNAFKTNGNEAAEVKAAREAANAAVDAEEAAVTGKVP